MREKLYDMPEDELLARILWGETRGGKDAMYVAWVVRNRVETDLWHDGKPDWWGEGYKGVLLKSAQFSCIDEGNVNLPKLLAVDESDKNYQTCLNVARSVMNGLTRDPTVKAVSYHANYCHPAWADSDQLEETVRCGRHIFYRLRRP